MESEVINNIVNDVKVVMQKELTIIIPTYNRGNVISYTLSLLRDQIVRNSEDVELIVCNNASTDDTVKVLHSIREIEPWFTFINYDKHVDIDDSIFRSITNVSGKFFLLFGDDDVPSPSMIDMLLISLKKYPQIGLLTFNYLLGFSDSSLQLRNITLKESVFYSHEVLYTDSKLFTEKYYGHMGFISVDVVRKEVWDKGIVNYSKHHEGYSFLTVMHSGAIGYDCLFLEYPLCIQRLVLKGGNEHAFSNPKLGIYQFVGIPRILDKLEELGAIDSWERCFENYSPNQNDNWYYSTISSIAEKPKEFAMYYGEIIKYQLNKQRILETKRLFSSVEKKTFILLNLRIKFRAKGGFQYFHRRLRRFFSKNK